MFWQAEVSIIITDDLTVVGYKPDHSDHSQAFTSLLQIAQQFNVKLNYDKLQYKQNEVNFFGGTFTANSHKPARSKVSAITAMPSPTKRNKSSHLLAWLIICPSFHWDCQSLQNQLESCQRTKYLSIGGLNIRQPSPRWSKKFLVLLFWHITTPKANHVADRSKYKRFWCLFVTRRIAFLFCK